jgi:hypothetical protein
MTLKEIKESLRTDKKAVKECMEFKKTTFKTADAVNTAELKTGTVSKALHTSKENDTEDVLKRTIIGNTYNWMDSHGDVHLDNTFKNSIKQRGEAGKIWHLHDHEQKMTSKVGVPTKVYEQEVQWSDLGVDKKGTTTALMMDTNVMKAYNGLMFQEYKDGTVDQHSVGMYYVKMDLAVNDSEFKEEFATWQANIDKIGNSEKATEEGHFWAVSEAKLIEISAVLEGSNELTPTVEAKDNQPPKGIDNDPLKDSQKDLNEKAKKETLLKLIKH